MAERDADSPPSEEFVPIPFLIVDSPEQIKAFTDPLRSRALAFLSERAATNQQVAQALGACLSNRDRQR